MKTEKEDTERRVVDVDSDQAWLAARPDAARAVPTLAKSDLTHPIKQVLDAAIAANIDPGSMEKLVALYERLEDRNAVREFNAAYALFRSECPTVKKTKTVKVVKKSGGFYTYDFEPLDRIMSRVEPVLNRHGFACWWDQEVTPDGRVRATFWLQHEAGHKVASTFACPASSTNPGMSDQQKYASATTFAKRQSAVAGLGIVTADQDNDGADPVDTIDDSQVADLEALIVEVGADRDRFCKWAGVEEIEQISVVQFPVAVRMLEAKRGKP